MAETLRDYSLCNHLRIVAVDLTRQGRTAPERAEYLAPVRWIKTVPMEQAISETGFFGNQNVVARPRDPKWEHTVQRLRKRFGVDADQA